MTDENAASVPSAGPSSTLIRDAVIKAAIDAGDGDMAAYLTKLAASHPAAFLTLLGKVLPLQKGRPDDQHIYTSIEFTVIDPQ